MTILNDIQLFDAVQDGSLEIDPFDENHIQPASIDLRLAPEVMVMTNGQQQINNLMQLKNGRVTEQEAMERVCIDPRKPLNDAVFNKHTIPENEALVLSPGHFVLGHTIERVGLADDLVGKVEGRSSYGRLGVAIHITAGFIDPGFSGTITLEISNLGQRPVFLFPGERICQLAVTRMSEAAGVPYGPGRGSKYQGQDAPTTTRLHKELEAPPKPEPEEDNDRNNIILVGDDDGK